MGTSKRGGSSFFEDIEDYGTVSNKKKSQSVADQIGSADGTLNTSPSSSKSQSQSSGKGKDDSFFSDINNFEKPTPSIANTNAADK